MVLTFWTKKQTSRDFYSFKINQYKVVILEIIFRKRSTLKFNISSLQTLITDHKFIKIRKKDKIWQKKSAFFGDSDSK